ncbi:MAG TPA: DUF3100 domain-containing protein [Candidatus Brachybacterium intestinipullorum]|uniref:DUF3100 domain-containing protein n=1 Tax=Candidatus Brachybacterium intestinipullorum TaxID=2838512 RepID=A0A9D2Q1L4_9MICO|nr:DUF3100 domain-containing protein [Candidatus Brachybacterium intestinipullorum]
MTSPTPVATTTDAAAPGSRRGVVLDMTLLIALVAATIVVAESIGVRSVPLTGSITITVLPLVFAVVLTMVLGIPAWRKGILRRVYSPRTIGFSGAFLIVIMLPLMARYGADVAPRLKEILSIGWVFLLQELGNLGTVVLGLPVALLLGLRRHAIGSTLGLGREGELAYISEKYTLNSDPGRGVLSMYLMGTLFGALFFSFFAPVLLGTGLDVRALAIASGMGSASMMTAASSTLAAQTPDLQDTIVSYAAASQLLTSFIGTYTMVFLAVPLQRAMYNLMMRGKDRLPARGPAPVLGAGAAAEAKTAPTARTLFAPARYGTFMAVLLLSVALVLFTQQMKLWVNPASTPITALTLGGIATLWLFSLLGLVIGDLMTLSRLPVVRDFPVLGWVSLVSLAGCLAWDGFVDAIGAVDFLSLTTPILAFAGVSVADRLVDLSKTSWKVAITAVFVFIGTYVGSALLAQFGLSVAGG